MVTSDELAIQLISKPGSPKTGIGRYAIELERGLGQQGVALRKAELTNPLPRSFGWAGRRLGYDLDTFFRSYPLRTDTTTGYVTHITSQTLGVLLLTQRLPRPVVVTVHDILPYMLRNEPEFNSYQTTAQRFMDSLAMRGLRRADRLIADSHYTKQTMEDTLGLRQDCIDVVHLGVDTGRFRPGPVPEDFRARYDVLPGQHYLLYVGSEDPRKNLPDLLGAFARVRSQIPDAALLKVGAPAFASQRQRHQQMCTSLGISQAVRWIDDVPDADLPYFYNLASVFAFPSRYEGFGFPVLEAMACGTPVVAARASSIPELAGDAAILLDDLTPEILGNALVHAILQPSHQTERLVHHAWRFGWADTIRSTREVYEAARASRGRSIS